MLRGFNRRPGDELAWEAKGVMGTIGRCGLKRGVFLRSKSFPMGPVLCGGTCEGFRAVLARFGVRRSKRTRDGRRWILCGEL